MRLPVAAIVQQLEIRDLLAVPATPNMPEIRARGEDWIMPEWKEAIGAENYRLFRSSDGGVTFDHQIYFGPDLSYLDRGAHLNRSITYKYKVQAVNSSGSSVDFSQIRTARTNIQGSSLQIDESSFDFDGTTFPMRIESRNSQGIDPTRPTWLLIHGWKSDPTGWANEMAAELNVRFPADTIMTIDWSTASASAGRLTPPLLSESRIQPTSEWLSKRLEHLHFSPASLKFIGHSHGSYVSNETAERLQGRVRGIIALNPAADDPLGFGFNPNSGNEVNFRSHALYSWAFVDPSYNNSDPLDIDLDSQKAASTAHYSFVVQAGVHDAVSMFTHAINSKTYASQWFDVTEISKTPLWELDQFDDDGVADSEDILRHEALIVTNPDYRTINTTYFFPVGNQPRLERRDPQDFEGIPGPAISSIEITGPGSTLMQAHQHSASLNAESSALPKIIIDEEVTNFDTATSGAFDVVYYASSTALSTSPLFEIGRRRVSSLRAYEKSRDTREFTLDDIPAGAISGGRTYVGVALNPGGSPDPDDMFWERVTIPTTFGVPDLVGQDFDFDQVSTTFSWGDSVQAEFEVANLGTGYAQGPFQAGVYFSRDTTFDSSDVLLGTATFPGLQGGSSTGTGLPIVLPGAPPVGYADGTHYIGLWVDRGNVVNETSEANNQGRGAYIDYRSVVLTSVLTGDGKPAIGALTVSPSEFIRGVKVDLRAENVVDDVLVNELRFYVDSNNSGHLDADDRFLDYGSKAGTTFTARVSTSQFPVGTNLLLARAMDNLGNYSPVKSTWITVNGNGPATPDAYESNESAATAPMLGSMGTYIIPNLSITQGDIDWFAFDVVGNSAAITARIEFFEEANDVGDLYLEVVRGGSSAGFSDTSFPGNTQEQVHIPSGYSTRYHVRIGGQNGIHGLSTNSNYKLTVIVAPQVGAPIPGALLASATTVTRGDSVSLWFESIGGVTTAQISQINLYRDIDNDGQIIAEEFVGADYGPIPDGPNGTYRITVSTANWAIGANRMFAQVAGTNGYGSPARDMIIQVFENQLPVTGSLTIPSLIEKGKVLPLSAEDVIDPDGTVAAVSFTADSNGNAVWDESDLVLGNGTLNAGLWSLAVDTSLFPLGTLVLFARARDNRGLWGSPLTARVEVIAPVNHAPSIGDFVGPTAVWRGEALTLETRRVEDVDGDVLLPVEYYIDADQNGIVNGSDTRIGIAEFEGEVWQLTVSSVGLPAGEVQLLAQVAETTGAEPLVGTAALSILVKVNAPPFVDEDTFTVAENSNSGVVVGGVSAIDLAEQTLNYVITGGNTAGAFAINSTTGKITVANSSALNFETTPQFHLIVQVTDNGMPALSASVTIRVNLTDANDAPLVAGSSVSQSVQDHATINPFVAVTVTDPDVQDMFARVTVSNGLVRGDFSAASVNGWNRFVIGNDFIYERYFPAQANIGGVVQAAVRGLVFVPRGDAIQPNTTELTDVGLYVTDGIANASVTTRLVTISVNNAPTLGNAGVMQPVNDGATIAPLAVMTLTDVDMQELLVSVTILNAAYRGDFTPASVAGWTRSTLGNNITYQRYFHPQVNVGATAQAAIRALIFQPRTNAIKPNSTELTDFQVTVSDGVAPAIVNKQTRVVTTSVNNVATIGGASAAVTGNDNAPVNPFSSLTVTDADWQEMLITVTILNGRYRGDFTNATPAQGWAKRQVVGNNITYKRYFSPQANVGAAAQAAFRALVFQPRTNAIKPGTTEATEFQVTVSDGVAPALADNGTRVTITSVNDAPVITGAVADQTMNNNQAKAVFSTLTVADPDTQDLFARVTITNGVHRGDLTPASATGWVRTIVGNQIVYERFFATTANNGSNVQAAIRALIFQPRTNVPVGTQETTSFTIFVNDGMANTTNATTSVITTGIESGLEVQHTTIPQPILKYDITTIVLPTITKMRSNPLARLLKTTRK